MQDKFRSLTSTSAPIFIIDTDRPIADIHAHMHRHRHGAGRLTPRAAPAFYIVPAWQHRAYTVRFVVSTVHSKVDKS
jgi:hypothetical protein